jgi:predicted nucleic acid-binding protein
LNGTLVDSNVIIDIVQQDPSWADWSADALLLAMSRGPVFVNQIVLAEVAAGYESPEAFEQAVDMPGLERRNLPWAASYLAGRAYLRYRRRGGARSAPLPDFYVGAHAAIEDLHVLTRDPRRVVAEFPRLTVISP